MTYETIITNACLLLASTILLISFRFDHWRKRAERAEAKQTVVIDPAAESDIEDRMRSFLRKQNLTDHEVEGEIVHRRMVLALNGYRQDNWPLILSQYETKDANARADRAEAALARVEAEIAKTPIKSTTVTAELVESIAPKTLPDYVTDFKYEIVRDASRGNGGGADLAEYSFKVDGQDMRRAFPLPDLIKIMTKGVDKFWLEYFEALRAWNLLDKGDQS